MKSERINYFKNCFFKTSVYDIKKVLTTNANNMKTFKKKTIIEKTIFRNLTFRKLRLNSCPKVVTIRSEYHRTVHALTRMKNGKHYLDFTCHVQQKRFLIGFLVRESSLDHLTR